MFSIIHNDQNINTHSLVQLYTDCGWNAYGFRTVRRTQLALSNSLWYCAAYNYNQELAGFVRLVGDGIYVVQLVDLMVCPADRRGGLGKQLIQSIVSQYSQIHKDRSIMLVDGSLIPGFYESLGFESSAVDKLFYQK